MVPMLSRLFCHRTIKAGSSIYTRRIRLGVQDTSLSRRRSPVRIRYALPNITFRHPKIETLSGNSALFILSDYHSFYSALWSGRLVSIYILNWLHSFEALRLLSSAEVVCPTKVRPAQKQMLLSIP